MISSPRFLIQPAPRDLDLAHGQRGAVLYVAMIMLILLALLGIAGMQVAGMQERMSASYRAVNLALQHTEQVSRLTECGLERLNEVPDVAASDCDMVDRSTILTKCDDNYDARIWVESLKLADALPPASGGTRVIRQIEDCMPGEARGDMGGPVNERKIMPVYQITTYQSDTNGGANPSSAAAIDIIFKL